jgi:glycosyltransferase involved in cell wall biosynthesis
MTPPRETAVPTLSVVIGCHNAAGVIEECLQALRAQTPPGIHQVIVADSSTDGTDRIIRDRFPEVTLLHFTEALTLPQLRARAIAQARGDVIAILDPYSIADRHWSAALTRQHQLRPNPVIGGTVELYEASRQDCLSWAQYLNEYGMFMPPMPQGPIEILAGSNVSYKRKSLEGGTPSARDEFWKTFVNDHVRAGDLPLWLAPSATVALRKPIPFGSFLRTRFDHGRCYAGMRREHLAPSERWLRALTAPLLPALFIWRWGKRYFSKGRYRTRFVSTLPLQLLLFGNWAFGEMIGYVAGPGTSCKKLFY